MLRSIAVMVLHSPFVVCLTDMSPLDKEQIAVLNVRSVIYYSIVILSEYYNTAIETITCHFTRTRLRKRSGEY